MDRSNLHHAQQGPRSPEEDASFFSRLTNWWIIPLFRIGYRRQLQEHDVYEVLDRYRAELVSNTLAAAWKDEIERAERQRQMLSEQRSHESTMRSAKRSWIGGVLKRMNINIDAFSILTPNLIQKNAEKAGLPPPPWWHGFGLVILILFATVVQVLSIQSWLRHAQLVSIPTRTGLVDMIFQKATRLSSKARQQNQFPDGKIVNLLTNDSFRMEASLPYLWTVVSTPINLVVTMGLLIHLLGPGPALLGGATMIIAIPLQACVTTRLAPWRRKLSEIADRRIERTHQILRSIQVIKLFTWEPSFLRRVIELRRQEVSMVRRLLLTRGMISTTSAAIPVLASTASFVLYAALGQQLDATIIFPALAFYTSMRAQMTNWPNGLSAVTDTLISVRRIEDFLLTEEIQSLPETDPSCPWAIEIQDGCFYWDRIQGPDEGSIGQKVYRMHSANNEDKGSADSYRSQILVEGNDPNRLIFLRDIQLQIPRGALVAVIGAVGHGKSSLLQAMVGNMPMQSGRL
ncbi:hypothetical protein DFQ27_000862, partial [Actinomortierella ambigua]